MSRVKEKKTSARPQYTQSRLPQLSGLILDKKIVLLLQGGHRLNKIIFVLFSPCRFGGCSWNTYLDAFSMTCDDKENALRHLPHGL
jgi:hypothetical protein